MPEISRFFGVIIKMYFDEHPPPHFHAEYGDEVVNVFQKYFKRKPLPP